MSMALPEAPQFLENFISVLQAANFMLIRAFVNSCILTIASIFVLLAISSLAGFVLGRWKGKTTSLLGFLILAGLMVPPSVVPTIWILKLLGLYKTMAGLVLIEAALSFPFSVLLYRAYMEAIPRELDEASFVDGCTGTQLFWHVVLPLMKPVTATISVITAINIFNDFVNPLYFLPGSKNVTVQMTLYNFMSTYMTKWNLLFADILLISIPPLIFFKVFNRKIISGMIAGAVKA